MNKRVMKKKVIVNSVESALADFLREKNAKGVSSLRNYEHSTVLFMADLGYEMDKPIEEITKFDVFRWIEILQERNVNGGGINSYLSRIRVFLYWCMREGYLEKFEIGLMKAQEPVPHQFTDEEIKVLLQKPKTEEYREHRTYTIINLILATGMRGATVCALRVDDLDFEKKQIALRSLKNNSFVILPMSRKLELVLKDYLKSWDITDRVFCDVAGGILTTGALRQGLIKYCKDRGIKGKGTHALRHSFARLWITNGGDAFSLQKMLTHSTMDMTKKYVRLYGTDMNKIINNYSPLDNIKLSNNTHRM